MGYSALQLLMRIRLKGWSIALEKDSLIVRSNVELSESQKAFIQGNVAVIQQGLREGCCDGPVYQYSLSDGAGMITMIRPNKTRPEVIDSLRGRYGDRFDGLQDRAPTRSNQITTRFELDQCDRIPITINTK